MLTATLHSDIRTSHSLHHCAPLRNIEAFNRMLSLVSRRILHLSIVDLGLISFVPHVVVLESKPGDQRLV